MHEKDPHLYIEEKSKTRFSNGLKPLKDLFVSELNQTKYV